MLKQVNIAYVRKYETTVASLSGAMPVTFVYVGAVATCANLIPYETPASPNTERTDVQIRSVQGLRLK